MNATVRRARARHATSAALLLASLLLPVACSDDGAPAASTWTLVTVNGAGVPAPHPLADVIEVVSGALLLREGGTAEETVRIRCRSNLPPGTSCTVDQPVQVRTGTYSRAEGWIRLGGTSYSATFTATAVTVEFGAPPSQGAFRRATFVYGR
jgi:hypothetical protein